MSEQYQVIYSSEAVQDLRDIYGYIAYELRAPEAARNQARRIRKKVQSLECLPERFPFSDVKIWKKRNTHKVPVDHYVIYYTVDKENYLVTILRIFYSAQNVNE